MKSILLAAPPGMCEAAAAYGCRVVHLAYNLDEQGRLIRPEMPQTRKGSMMAICHSGTQAPEIDRSAFLTQIIRECSARGFSGVICDFEGEYSPILGPVCKYLSSELAARGISFSVPENYAHAVLPPTNIVVSSAISGGSLRQRLNDATKKYGAERIILECERNCEDFTLPANTGSGKRMAVSELDNLFSRLMPIPYFSSDLCTYYFTYRDRNNYSHFVLFDNASSIRKKLSVAADAGITSAILVYPEIQEIVRDILL